ncbi:MAG: hypothetical protein P8188_02775 [Gemmatimonadota bacterium]
MAGWAPAFLLGVATAVVLETGMGLLLFLSPGLLPALTGVLAVGLGSLASGLASVRSGPEAGVRWRWLLAAGSLVGAAVLSVGWSFQGEAGPDSWLGRGGLLAFLVALPLYSLGACLAAVARSGAEPRPGAWAALGGAAGVLVVGLALVPRFEPFSVYLFGLMCVALSALGVVTNASSDGPGRQDPIEGGDPWALERWEP